MKIKDMFKLPSRPRANISNIIYGKKYRITILTEGLIRLEYCEDGIFEDRATQAVLNRDFVPVDFQVKETEEELEISTWRLRLNYNKKEFDKRGLKIQVIGHTGPWSCVWHYGDSLYDLKGTTRTLDTVDGACELEHGLISKESFSVMDDSKSLTISEDGWVNPRKKNIKDIYFWGYGRDYFQCLKDFYYLCGKAPMLPRFALGNWWSRYYEYTEDSYLDLMKRFDEEGIPFSVAVIDMDWHLVNINPKYGSGWTGYTWNKEFFPDPKRFMDKLHKQGMRITLNVHPADGVRAHEEMYEEMAKELGKDISKEEPIIFDITDPTFLSAYFKYLHHPNEEKGVDFWWIDWQQGGITKMEGMDPLWMLNHFHFLDSAKNKQRPLTFSRYAGPGSHRYPIGFSGDTVVTWDSLKFQPYFTSTAANIGYGWWSHDIGGHTNGYKDDEMAGRWLQLGVFSPINRLHSTKNEFNGKEPWRYKKEIRKMMDDFLKLRHRLVPYLYTMNHRAYNDDIPLILPMYYHHPMEEAAYEVPNEFYYGSELIVIPITSKRIDRYNYAKEKVWLPNGIYIDFFHGTIYEGRRKIDMYRDINSLPVLAKAGAIIPMTDEINASQVSKNPKSLIFRIFGGDDGEFTLYEDDNETCSYEKGACVTTKISLSWNKEQNIVIHPAEGDLSLIPEERSYTIELYGCTESKVQGLVNGEKVWLETNYDKKKNRIIIRTIPISVTKEIRITFISQLKLPENREMELIYTFLDQAEIEFDIKEQIYCLLKSKKNKLAIISELQAMKLSEDLMKCITEILTARMNLNLEA